jgi:NAD(P)H-dependent FMN reductase
MSRLGVVVVSTRPSREGLPVAQWFFQQAKKHGKFEVELVDLKEHALPVFDEPKHPRLGQYEHEHTKKWSATVKALDAFVFVTPEYNFAMAPALLNALDYLFHEWAYKPAAFVSYGGISGGMRSQQMAKLPLTSLKVMPIPEAVSIPGFTKQIENGVFKATEMQEKSATSLLDELARWAGALATLRTKS